MEVVEASSGGNGFQVFDRLLADGADFLGRGLPQLEHGVMGEPLNLAPFCRADLGPGEKELEDLRVGRPGTTAGWGWRSERKSRPGRVPDRETGGKDHEIACEPVGFHKRVPCIVAADLGSSRRADGDRSAR